MFLTKICFQRADIHRKPAGPPRIWSPSHQNAEFSSQPSAFMDSAQAEPCPCVLEGMSTAGSFASGMGRFSACAPDESQFARGCVEMCCCEGRRRLSCTYDEQNRSAAAAMMRGNHVGKPKMPCTESRTAEDRLPGYMIRRRAFIAAPRSGTSPSP